MADNAHISQNFISSIIAGEVFADASLLAFRDSSSFRAGELHRHTDQWDKLFQSSDNNFSEVLDWIHNFIRIDKFFTHYKASYKGVNYNCERLPARIFANHPSCKAFAQFISDTLIKISFRRHLPLGQGREMSTSISERFRQFCFFTKRSTLLLENSRKIIFLHLFIIEQHAKLLPYLLILVD